MKLIITMTVERQTLEDIFVTALEGGSNYWYFFKDKDVELIRKAVPKEEIPEFSLALFKAVYDKGLSVDVYDREDPDEPIGVISMRTMQERLQKMVNSPEGNADLMSEINEEGDASTSDCVFQYIALGEVVYG